MPLRWPRGNGANGGLDGAGKLGEQAVAHQLYDSPMVLGDQGPQHLLSVRFQPRQRPNLILSHEAGETGHVSCNNGSKPAFHARSPSNQRLITVDESIYDANQALEWSR